MPTKKEKKASPKEITFTCKFCEKSKPLSEMTVITCFFPAVVACRDCSKKLC